MSKASKLSILLLPLALAGCPNPGPPDAIVHYHQVGACNGGQGQSGDPSTFYSAGPNQAYVVFAIDSIDNSQVAQPWTAKVAGFHVNPSDSFDPTLMIYRWVLGPFAMVDTPIPANVNYGFSPSAYGALVVQTSAANGADEANVTNYQLLYTPAVGAPGVIMEKGPPTSWPDTQDCSSIALK